MFDTEATVAETRDNAPSPSLRDDRQLGFGSACRLETFPATDFLGCLKLPTSTQSKILL